MNEREALVKVRDMLQSGQIRHTNVDNPREGEGFNMAQYYHEHECGTIACIGGWVAHFMGHRDPAQYVRDRINHPLYYPPNLGSYRKISTQSAITAIDNYFESGDPLWEMILGDNDHE